MKNYTIVILLVACIQAKAQVKFEMLDLPDAIQKFAGTGKIIMAQFISENCDQCNDVADKAFEAPALGDVVNRKCIALKIGLNYSGRESFIDNYNPQKSLGTFFISGSGELIHRYASTTTRYTEYISQIEKAYDKLTEGKVTLRELDKEWNDHAENIEAMMLNLTSRAAVGLPTDSLLEVFVNRLPADLLRSPTMLGFIARQAPALFSKANTLMHRDYALFIQAWNMMPLQQRIFINNQITYKSMKKAIGEKNAGMATRVANFSAATYTDRTSVAARQAYDRQMLNYFIGVKDTVAYLQRTVDYCDRYLMTINVDTILHRDSLRGANARSLLKGDTIQDQDHPERTVVKKAFSFAPQTQFFANQLNQGAWLLYTSTGNAAFLDKALQWAKRAIDFYEGPEVMDTYAKILYKTGNKPEAVTWQNKAVNLLKARKFNYKTYEETLGKMKKGEIIK